jgi:cell shape-determining protein MreC
VDAGESQGVKKDMVVFGELQYAIGRVTDVRTNSSVITLFSSSNQKETVIIGTSTSGSSTEAIAEGRGGGNFYIKLPRNVEVAVGDPIVWPASSIVLLGAVEKVDADKGGTYAHIYFKSPINIQSLRYVQIKEQLY